MDTLGVDNQPRRARVLPSTRTPAQLAAIILEATDGYELHRLRIELELLNAEELLCDQD